MQVFKCGGVRLQAESRGVGRGVWGGEGRVEVRGCRLFSRHLNLGNIGFANDFGTLNTKVSRSRFHSPT